jgi:flagellar biosynthesis/type III secretory pathway M-ring protein FliF/YscJ
MMHPIPMAVELDWSIPDNPRLKTAILIVSICYFAAMIVLFLLFWRAFRKASASMKSSARKKAEDAETPPEEALTSTLHTSHPPQSETSSDP